MSPEATEQAALIDWCDKLVAYGICGELRWLYHVPNGGWRSRTEAAILIGQGVRPGVSDLCLPVARGGYHGLYIEMKAGRGKPSEKQLEFLAFVQEQGYRAGVFWSARSAQDLIIDYMGLRDHPRVVSLG